MDNQESILAKADIKKVSNKKRKIIKIVYLVIVAAVLVFGLIFGSESWHSDGGTNVYGEKYPESDNTFIDWFGVPLYHYKSAVLISAYTHKYLYASYTEYDWKDTYPGNIVWVSGMFIILLGAPFYIDAIHKRQCKNTALTISESKIYGSYNSFLFMKTLEMPIEKVDNLTTISGLMDKLRTGVTLGVCSASGVIKIHFVHNAEEVVSAAMKRINEIKEKEKSSRVVAQTNANVPASTSDKLKELLAMKESGLINEEEFTKKREEILSNM